MNPLPQGLKDCRQALLCRGRPAAGAGLDETAAEPHTAHKWLDGVSDALTDFLRRLRETHPSATARIRPGPTPTADYRPSRRSPWPAADEGVLPETCTLRSCKYLNNIVEQDHRFIKRLVKPGLGFGFFHTAWRTLRGYEVMNMIRKGQLLDAERGDIVSQNRLIAQAFGLV